MSRDRSTSLTKSSSTTAFPTLEVEVTTTVDGETLTPRLGKPEGYVHKPRLSILAWLIVSLPLIAWDMLYVFLRPHTMPGGKLHSPLWTPYALYGAVDYIYGWPAWNGHVGFTAAQSVMNGAESAFYGWYLYVVGRQAVDRSYAGTSQLKVKGEGAKLAVLLAFSAAVMTVSKTMLYCESPLSDHRVECTL